MLPAPVPFAVLFDVLTTLRKSSFDTGTPFVAFSLAPVQQSDLVSPLVSSSVLLVVLVAPSEVLSTLVLHQGFSPHPTFFLSLCPFPIRFSILIHTNCHIVAECLPSHYLPSVSYISPILNFKLRIYLLYVPSVAIVPLFMVMYQYLLFSRCSVLAGSPLLVWGISNRNYGLCPIPIPSDTKISCSLPKRINEENLTRKTSREFVGVLIALFPVPSFPLTVSCSSPTLLDLLITEAELNIQFLRSPFTQIY